MLVLPAIGQDSAKSTKSSKAKTTGSEQQIRKLASDYTKAFNSGDAKKLAGFWSENAVYVNPTNGQRVTGRQAIQAQFEQMFNSGSRFHLTLNLKSIRFPSSTVAIEEGTAQIVGRDGPPAESEYMAVYVQESGKWLLDTVREVDLPQPPSHFEQLQELEWLIGEWVDQDDNTTVRTRCEWTKNKNFILRTFSLSVKDRITLEGTQVIGWDPAGGHIRSWVFDSDGGFAQGVWTREGDRWLIKASGVLADGRRGSAIHILTYRDNDHCTWQSISREVDIEN